MIVIDTNVYSAALRGDEAVATVLRQSSAVYVPVVVIGELKAGFLGGSMNEHNQQKLNIFLANNRVRIINIEIEATEQYAQLKNYCKQFGSVLSNNDLWIATLAQELKCRLVTFDKDFEVFSELFGENLLILDN